MSKETKLVTCPICNNKRSPRSIYSKNICTDCFESLPGFKASCKRPAVKICENKHWYIGYNQNANCPICIDKIRNVKCEICKESYYETDTHLKRIKDNSKHFLCENCKDKLIGKGKNVRKCSQCMTYYKTDHNFKKCPNCNLVSLKRYKMKCERCNKIFESVNSLSYNTHCQECKEEIKKSESVKKYERYLNLKDTIIKDNLLLRPLRFDVHEYRNFSNKICVYCGREYKPTGPRQHSCLNCYNILHCEACNNKYISICSYKDKKEVYYKACSKSCATKLQNKYGFSNLTSLENIDNFKNTNNIIKEKPVFVSMKKYTEIDNKNAFDFNNIAGVWCKYDIERNIVLDVMLTLNIYKEYNKIMKRLENPTSKKYIEFNKISENIKFFFVSDIKNWNDGLIKELDFALETKAEHWSPAPGFQTKLYNELKKEGKQ